ncbi:MAG: hypothetical protein UV73_C0004G0050 [Candidatus Gottesmanbacteria bacterium GW2011_GWA2_43_14]|uniref:Minus agglutinin n=1 Tax=Candidatus Gottesmanbacteria bacterium GW2011_GWA2_43_14 TaxID=1618443 RepID=A0A0G1GGH3_9BACT|nr:MAG: hypothetical protein UV73_C0004G0050 [Candidatus Gottesmanbacteria bacterium GW2011_GWA2_43_14]
MEQHSVPRNISSFQFHLIGDMTVRQFAYLLGGCLIGFVLYKLLPLPGFLAIPAAGAAVLTGFAFAFVPIQERPLDKWIVAFIKSITSPTQYLWQKQEEMPDILAYAYNRPVKSLPQNHLEAHADAKKKLDNYLNSLPNQPHQQINIREKHYVDSTLKLFNTTNSFIPAAAPSFTAPSSIPPVSVSALPFTTVLPITPVVKPVQSPPPPVKADVLHPPLSAAVAPVNPKPLPPAIQKPIEVKKAAPPQLQQIPVDHSELTEIRREKEKLEKELERLKAEISKSSKITIKPVEEKEPVKPTIKTVTPKSAVNEIGIPKLPQAPNIIMGVIKDSNKRLLPNIILTIKDIKDNPHRALKTNRLGQFSTATPLQNGTYFVEAEDPMKRYTFDIAEINLSGKIFLPIEITAKGEKEKMREQLNKELFSNPGI